MKTFYKIPIDFHKLTKSAKHPRSDIETSIKDFIDLVILSAFGEYRRDDSFGCEIWEKEFDILPLETKWQVDIKKSIEKSVISNEMRLGNIKVDIRTDETSFLMKKIEVRISGQIQLTGEPFEHRKTIYLCPKSTA